MKSIRVMLFVTITLLATACLQAQNVVTDWNTIASSTIVANGGKASVASGVWFAYVSIAVYDAVNAIHRTYEPFYYDGVAPAGTSDEAAAVAAAHRVLVSYFPAQQTNLDAAYSKSLNALVAQRAGDGLEANVPYTPGSGPGVWQPTPPAFLPALTPWLGHMQPFTMKSAAQFLPDGPTPLADERWVAEYNETRL